MLSRVLSSVPLNGNKTWTAGIALMLYAVGGYFTGNVPADQAIELFLEGFGLIGVGHKIEKLIGGSR